MYDVIRCTAEPGEHGFEHFFQLDDIKKKILQAQNLQEAAKQRNRKSLIMLRDHAFDEGAIKLIAEKKSLCLLIDLGALIRTRGVPRAVMMSKLRNLLRLCVKHGAFYAFASFAEKEEQMRSPDEIAHIAMLLGLNRGQAKFALSMIQDYL